MKTNVFISKYTKMCWGLKKNRQETFIRSEVKSNNSTNLLEHNKYVLIRRFSVVTGPSVLMIKVLFLVLSRSETVIKPERDSWFYLRPNQSELVSPTPGGGSRVVRR